MLYSKSSEKKFIVLMWRVTVRKKLLPSLIGCVAYHICKYPKMQISWLGVFISQTGLYVHWPQDLRRCRAELLLINKFMISVLYELSWFFSCGYKQERPLVALLRCTVGVVAVLARMVLYWLMFFVKSSLNHS